MSGAADTFVEDVRCMIDASHISALDKAFRTAMKINLADLEGRPLAVLATRQQILLGPFNPGTRMPQDMLPYAEFHAQMQSRNADLAAEFRKTFTGEVCHVLCQTAASDPVGNMTGVFLANSIALIFHIPDEELESAPRRKPWRIGLFAFDNARTVDQEDQCIEASSRSRTAARQLNVSCRSNAEQTDREEDDFSYFGPTSSGPDMGLSPKRARNEIAF